MIRRINVGGMGGCLVIAALLLYSCAPAVPLVDDQSGEVALQEEKEAVLQVFLIGNTGASPGVDGEKSRALLHTQLVDSRIPSVVVLLGNTIPCCALASGEAEDSINAIEDATSWIDVVNSTGSRLIVLPGHYENPGEQWARADTSMTEALIEQRANGKDIFLPSKGFPGPIALQLADDVTLIALDTQYWLNGYTVPPDTLGYEIREPTDVLVEFQDLLFKHRNDRILVAGHHPLYSNGPYGGRYSFGRYIFPVPGFSALALLYRRLVGRRQDLSSAPYRLFRQEMLRLLEGQHHLVYAAAHDHSLQYFRKDNRRRIQHHVVSGSASRQTHVSQGRGVEFASNQKGFSRLEYFEDGSIELNMFTVGSEEPLLFDQVIKPPDPIVSPVLPTSEAGVISNYQDSVIIKAINPNYAKVSGVGKFLFGKQYRHLWAAPVEAPLLDVATVAGGLTPTRLGGQSQSVTMRFEGDDGDFYMLRSIDKVATRSLSPAMRRTFARSIVQDQVAMMHPYGAFVIPPLARAAGIFHTNPQLVFVPDDPRMGQVSSFLANQIALFEERPDEDMSDKESFGYAKNIIGSEKLFSKIEGDNDHRVDPKAFARARLFDMLIADHDRTLDNFRWAAYEPYEWYEGLRGDERTQGKVYVPVPRDRDKAFAKVDGLFPSLYRLLSEPAWQPFAHQYGYLRGLNRKGMLLDRRFSGTLSREDWVGIARDIQRDLTDTVIEKSILEWPAPIQELAGEELIETLKSRREKLDEVAHQYYDVLADVIDVVGSNKHEMFDITRTDNDHTEIILYKTNKEGDIRRELLRRTVRHDETREIRLYGLAGNDRFVIRGNTTKGIRVIAVGGSGDDVFIDSSYVKQGFKKTRIFDVHDGTVVNASKETKSTLALTSEVNRYDVDGYKPNLIRPIGYFGVNADDGLFIGTGFKWTQHGFRKNPHLATHQLMGNFAARTRAFNVRYLGNYVSVIDKWGLDVEVGVYNPNTIRNFYGLGNETEDVEESRRFYQARFSNLILKSLFFRSYETGITIHLGPSLEITDVRNEEDRFVGQPQAGISQGSFDHLFFGSLEASVEIGDVDLALNPMQGFRFNSTLKYNKGLRETNDSFLKMEGALTLYLSPSLSPQATLALRIGGAHNIGSFPFFESNTLGGNKNLRGYRGTRFAGRTSFYQNVDVRVQVAEFAGYLGYGRVGVSGFMDNGRVWTDGETSRIWHQGFGGGVWMNYFEQVLIATEAGFSSESETFALRLGFMF